MKRGILAVGYFERIESSPLPTAVRGLTTSAQTAIIKPVASANLDANRLLKIFNVENGNSTPEERGVLATHVGGGGLKQICDENGTVYREGQHVYRHEQRREYDDWGKPYEVKAEALAASLPCC